MTDTQKEWPPRLKIIDGPGALRLLFTMVRDGVATVDQAMECLAFDEERPVSPASKSPACQHDLTKPATTISVTDHPGGQEALCSACRVTWRLLYNAPSPSDQPGGAHDA